MLIKMLNFILHCGWFGLCAGNPMHRTMVTPEYKYSWF